MPFRERDRWDFCICVSQAPKLSVLVFCLKALQISSHLYYHQGMPIGALIPVNASVVLNQAVTARWHTTGMGTRQHMQPIELLFLCPSEGEMLLSVSVRVSREPGQEPGLESRFTNSGLQRMCCRYSPWSVSRSPGGRGGHRNHSPKTNPHSPLRTRIVSYRPRSPHPGQR
jgi:hypothetical protein